MGRLEEYVEAVTRRLRPDAELHWDISREVRAHLEDAAEEARTQGLSEEESIKAALKAFGNSDEIAEALWQANRRRMRLHAVIKWALRVTLLPAALLVTAYVCLSSALDIVIPPWPREGMRSIGEIRGLEGLVFPLRVRSHLTEDEKFLAAHLDDPEGLVQRFPKDPAVYAYWVQATALNRFPMGRVRQHEIPEIAQRGLQIGPEEVKQYVVLPDEAAVREVMDMLERGEQVDPDNAFYNYMKFLFLADLASLRVVLHDEDDGLRALVLAVHDRAMLDRGVQEFMKGAGKPYYKNYVQDMLERELALFAPPVTLVDQARLLSVENNARSFDSQDSRCFRGTVESVFDCAGFFYNRSMASPASQGERERLLDILPLMTRPITQRAPNASSLELLTASFYMQQALQIASCDYELENLSEPAADAHRRLEVEERWGDLSERVMLRNKLWPHMDERRWPMVMNLCAVSELSNYTQLREALCKAEHVAAEQAALGLLNVLLVLFALRAGASTLCQSFRGAQHTAGSPLYFIGWRGAGRIVIVSLLGPLALYIAYKRLVPGSSMQYGLWSVLPWVALELGALVSLMLILFHACAYSAIRSRCMDAGIEVPTVGFLNPLRSKTALAGLVASFAVAVGMPVAFLLWWYPSAMDPWWGVLMPGAAVVVGALLFVLWQFWLLGRQVRLLAHFQRTFMRCYTCIVLAFAIVLALASHIYLRSSEARFLRALHGAQVRAALHEQEKDPALEAYRDHLRELNRRWLEEHGQRQ